MITRREFLNKSRFLLLALTISGCNPSASSIPIPDTQVEETTMPSANATQITDIHFVTGTPPETGGYKFAELFLGEAFARHGITFHLKFYPSKRAAEMLTQDQADGDAYRVYGFPEMGDYPNHFRIEEPIGEILVAGYATQDGITLNNWEDLNQNEYRIGYRRGVHTIKMSLSKVVTSDNLTEADTHEQGLKMLLAGRFDIYVGALDDIAAVIETDAFKEAQIKNVGIVEKTYLHPYLHKRYADLAPKIAETMREMKTEGLFDQYVEQILSEIDSN